MTCVGGVKSSQVKYRLDKTWVVSLSALRPELWSLRRERTETRSEAKTWKKTPGGQRRGRASVSHSDCESRDSVYDTLERYN